MSERGVFAVDRGIWDHPTLASRDPFSRREAWLWLVSEAAWKSRIRRIGSAIVEIMRGQLAHSLRFIAEAWGWPKSNVARFLTCLKTDTMIDTKTVHGITVITICKYDEYQRVSLPDRDNIGTDNGTELGQQRDKQEDIKNIEVSIPRKSRKGNSTSLPEGYLLPEKVGLYGHAKGLRDFEIGREHEKFCNHARQNDRRCVDWEAAERNWLLGAAEKLGRGPKPATEQRKPDWDLTMRAYTGGQPGMRTNWAWGGAEPGYPGCIVPPEIQRKHGFEPAVERVA